jgi:hypothetical protein
MVCEDSDFVGFKIVAKLSGTHDHCITYLFHF